MNIEFGLACYYGQSAGHFKTKIRSLVLFLTELLRVQLLETHCRLRSVYKFGKDVFYYPLMFPT